MGLRHYLLEWTPLAAMVIVECLDVGLTTLSKAAMSRGMNHFVFVVYSNALATLILLPSSFILNRTSRAPPLSPSLLCKLFFLGLVGITVMQNCVFTGVNYSSPTLASAMSNLIPAFTFVLAVIFRMEKLDIRSSRSQIKIMGTVLSISGALIVTLYKGTPIGGSQIQLSPSRPFLSILAETNNWVTGALFLATADLSLAIWNIAQAAILKGYPSQLTIVAFYCLFGTIQCAILSLIIVRDPNAWTLRPDIEFISIFYSAIFGSVVTFSVETWSINKKGPVFVAMFKPVGIAIAALVSVVFLGDTLHVGSDSFRKTYMLSIEIVRFHSTSSVVGALVIVVGFYTVLWAQSKEENGKCREVDRRLSSSSSQKSPLLESHRNETNFLA